MFNDKLRVIAANITLDCYQQRLMAEIQPSLANRIEWPVVAQVENAFDGIKSPFRPGNNVLIYPGVKSRLSNTMVVHDWNCMKVIL